MSTEAPPLDRLAESLSVLSSRPRLELLHALRTPRRLAEIRATAEFTREGESPDRAMSRQAVRGHLDRLLDAGLVRRAASEEGDLYVLSHERVFALVDEIRGLAKLRPLAAGSASEGTITLDDDQSPKLPPRPRLYLAYGRDDGVAFPLRARRTTIGRGARCDIVLDYDPYLSHEHCEVTPEGGALVVRDLGSRNGTWVNGERLGNSTRRLAAGDALHAGRSILVVQM